ncbi:hypothetical protein Pcinc_010898 [Petrolisthes cinctipes]|uniref:Uncharacterized protein n=1 Tax=Petrolisthes cinctipes TaxID=88211 RepID=A0AAE1KV01_PETCI|nr:hypothetical protein Pcinc_010898 [Petrolisthes cinctipes]
MLRAGSRIESMDISQILNRARAMLVEEDAGTVLAGVEGTVSVQLKSGVSSQVEVLVLSARPLNFDFILGMNALLIFKGVTVRTPNDVKFGVDEVVQCGMVERPLNPLDIKFITSAENKADVLTRVPKKWLSSGSQLVCGVVASVPKNEISKIHITSGNPGIKLAPESIAIEGGNEQPDYEDFWDVEPDESLVVHQPVNVGELRGLDMKRPSSESEGSDTGRPLPCRGSRERRPARLFQYNDLP